MCITVTTKSGSVYRFVEVRGETHMVRNYTEEGVLAEPVNIVPGEELVVNYYELSSYDYRRSENISTYKSTPVVKVEIA